MLEQVECIFSFESAQMLSIYNLRRRFFILSHKRRFMELKHGKQVIF